MDPLSQLPDSPEERYLQAMADACESSVVRSVVHVRIEVCTMTKAMGLRCSGPATAENRAHQRQKQDISRFSGQQDDLEMMDTLAKSSSWIKNPETRKEHWANVFDRIGQTMFRL